MTKNNPAAADRWVVSTRAHGELLTATVSLPSIELILLGIPQGFTPVEIQSWLKDLAGVAIETSRSDRRVRPIPQLLHHALTGLLFSQTELWSHTGHPLPCAAVFVEGETGMAFGWVGRARVVLLVNGEPFEPQWVIVRDESGHEAMSASLAQDAHALLTLEYWPDGEDSIPARGSVDAECGHAFAELPRSDASAGAPQPGHDQDLDTKSVPGVLSAWASVPPPTEPLVLARAPLSPPPDSLPTQQPGLAPSPTQGSSPLSLDRPDAAQMLPSTRHPSSGTFAIPPVPAPATSPPAPAERIQPVPTAAEQTISEAADVGQGAPPSTDRAPLAVWSPERSSPPAPYLTLPPVVTQILAIGSSQFPERPPAPPDPVPPAAAQWAGEIAGDEPPAPEAVEAEPPPTELQSDPGHPVGRWLSRLLGFSRRPAPKLPEVSSGPHASGYDWSPETPSAPIRRGGIAPVGLHEILGQVPGQVPGSLAPYPLLELKPPAKILSGPIQIEREPVGADPAFDIPRLPKREAPKPVRAPAPDLFVAHKAPPSAPRASQPPPQSPVPVPVSPPAVPEVPEPPAEFLAAFEASSHREPFTDLTLRPPSHATPVDPRASQPPPPSALAPPAAPASRLSPAPLLQVPAAAPPARPATPAPSAAAAPPVASPSGTIDARHLASTDVAALMREMPLPMPSAPLKRSSIEPAWGTPAGAAPESAAEDEIPDGMLIAQRATVMPPGARSRLAPVELLEEPGSRRPPVWRRPWAVSAFVIVLLGIGWMVGPSQAPDDDIHATPVSRLLRSVGLGGARFRLSVDSDPPGAWIGIDGKDVSRRTPTTLEVVPGKHVITLSMPDLGSVQVTVKGARGQKVNVSEALHGALDVTALDASLPVKMSLDGQPQGWLPVHLDKLPPGLHEVQFGGPNMQSWGQNVNISIRQTTEIVAKPMTSPATGVVQVQASLNDDNGTAPLAGATVYVDGDLRGATPLTLELPRGPHSLRVAHRGETAPVQVIDLPGGNQRFASFQFGLDSDLPPLKLQGNYSVIPAGKKPVTVSASLDGLDVRNVREAWMHVRTPDGLWRRYDMALTRGARGAVLSTVFPGEMFDAQGRSVWYLSAATAQGDEFFTEIQHSAR